MNRLTPTETHKRVYVHSASDGRYRVELFHHPHKLPKIASIPHRVLEIDFQRGTAAMFGANGITIEALLTILLWECSLHRDRSSSVRWTVLLLTLRFAIFLASYLHTDHHRQTMR